MKKNHGIARAVVAAGLALSMAATPIAALAAGQGDVSGTQPVSPVSGTQTKNSDDRGVTSGNVNLTYSTVNDTWVDPDNPDTPHNNGTYQVVIPTNIQWLNMPAGKVPTYAQAKYEVTVRGVFGEDKRVDLHAAANPLANGNDQLTVSLGSAGPYANSSWQAREAGVRDDKGNVIGTAKDQYVSVTGNAKPNTTYIGTITYTSSLNTFQ